MRRIFHSRSTFPNLAALVLLSHFSLAVAAGTPAGTIITNVASGNADPLLQGQPPVNGLSNLISTTVLPVCSVSVTPNGSVGAPGQQKIVLPGESAVFAYQIINVGNVVAQTAVSVAVPGESAFAPVTTLYLDRNNNGELDTDERTPISSVNLPIDGSARVLILAQSSAEQRGDGFVNLVAGCVGQPVSDNNVASLRLSPPPELSFTKSFSPVRVKPGDTTTVTLTATNSGLGESREVIVSDDLSALSAQGLSYVAGSAQVSGGTLESGSGSTWQAGAAGNAQALRVRQSSLKPGASLSLSFKMLAGSASENQALLNTAFASTGSQNVQAQASLISQYTPAVALGPLGSPEAADGTSDDQQTKTFALVNKETCFNQTLKNTGDVADNFNLSDQVVGNTSALVYKTVAGQPLALPISLKPGESADFQVCLTPEQAGALRLTLTAEGGRKTQNSTTDIITNIQAGLPDVIKSVTPSGLVPTGTELNYTLTVRNTYNVPLNGVVISDPLNASLSFISASDNGKFNNGAVVWPLGTLAAGESRQLSIKAMIGKDTADGTDITNVFSLRSDELSDPLASNQTSSPVWTSKLVIEKKVDKPSVTYGDLLTYTLTVRNLSAKAPLLDGIVSDTPVEGLEYVPGTAKLGTQPLADPQRRGKELIWNIGTLPPSSNVTITYQIRVNIKANQDLLNTVVVSGKAAVGQVATAIASNQASAKVKLKLLNFAPLNDIVGTVYVDRDNDGRYELGTDQAVQRARILLAGGREVLTDAQGRYHFKDVPQGVQALRLDPLSVPSMAKTMPADGGLRGTRTLNILGLISADFPLEPLSGDINALRSVSLSQGPLMLSKTVKVDGQRYSVTTVLKTTQPLLDFVLDDPLPDGAFLKDGRNSLTGTLITGETTVTYSFDWAGERRTAVTDPDVRWRY